MDFIRGFQLIRSANLTIYLQDMYSYMITIKSSYKMKNAPGVRLRTA